MKSQVIYVDSVSQQSATYSIIKVENSLSAKEASDLLSQALVDDSIDDDPIDSGFYRSKRKMGGRHIIILALRHNALFKIYHPATGMLSRINAQPLSLSLSRI